VTSLAGARQVIAEVIGVWNGAPADRLPELLAATYRGHMLGVPNGERDGAGYPDVIRGFRAANPGVDFGIVEQFIAGDRCVSRLEAHRAGTAAGSSSVSHGINIARFDSDGRLAEEWAVWSPWADSTIPRS